MDKDGNTTPGEIFLSAPASSATHASTANLLFLLRAWGELMQRRVIFCFDLSRKYF
jgi:hypothetical protein